MTPRSLCILAVLAAALSFGCSGSTAPEEAAKVCTNSTDCPAGDSCVNGHCAPSSNTRRDAGDDPLQLEDAGSGPDASANPSDPNNAHKDTDCDGLSDAEEFANVYPGGKKTDPSNPDTDGDGLLDGVELGRTSSPDPNCAFVGDADPASRTNPVAADSDGDGIADGAEDRNHDGRLDPGESDPNGADSDGDAIPDGVEDKNHNGVVDPGETNPAARDTDGDGIPDGVEDANRNGVVDPGETDPTKADTDGDGCVDGVEDRNWNHVKDPGETDPLTAGDCGVALSRDTDCDGIPDKDEPTYGTDPNKADSDGDGLPDGLEIGVTTNPDPTHCPNFQPDLDPSTRTNPMRVDSDCDGLKDGEEDLNRNGRRDANETDPSKRDTDGDGLADGLERGIATNPDPTNCPHFTADQDPQTKTDPTNPDSDGDGIADGAEDADQDGAVDPGELNPQTAADGTGPAAQACTTAQLRPVSFHESSGADITVAAAPGYSEIVRPKIAGTEKAIMLYDPTSKVVGFAASIAPIGADAAAEEAAALNRLRTLGTVSNNVSQTFTTWDGYPAVHALYDLSGNTDLKARSNDVAELFLGNATDMLAGSAGMIGPVKIEAEYVHRSGQRTIVVMAIMPASSYDGSKPFHLSDLGGGSALAQFGDANAAQCEVFDSQPPTEVDFLWVVDNSGSMQDYQQAVANAGNTMIAKLQNSTINWRMAATTSSYYVSTSGANGLRPFTTDVNTIKAWFTSGGTNWFGTSGNSKEELLESTRQVISGTNGLLPATAGSATKLRPNATLVIILLGDADDQSSSTSADFVSFLKNYDPVARPNTRAQLHGIVCLGTSGCPDSNGNNETQNTPHKVETTIKALGGVAGDIEVANQPGGSLGPTIDAILNAAIAGVSPYTTRKAPIASTMKMAMDPTALLNPAACDANDVPRDRTNGFDFDGVSQRVLFFGACRPTTAGKKIALSYRYWSDLTSNANGTPDPCTPACSAPFVCDRDQGRCVCPADCGAPKPGATYLCEPTTCRWVCSPDCNGCGSNFMCDAQSCQCQCNPNITCGPGFRFDTTACKCVCDAAALGCTGQYVADTNACACVCPSTCATTCASKGQRCDVSKCDCSTGPN